MVSFLHIIFEFLAFKNDVAFFANTDTGEIGLLAPVCPACVLAEPA